MRQFLLFFAICGMMATASASNLKPTHCQSWAYEDGEWTLDGNTIIGYDERGNMIDIQTLDDPCGTEWREVYTYTAENMFLTDDHYIRYDKGEWKYTSHGDFSWDTVVKTWQIGYSNVSMDNGSKYRWYIVVTRDDMGRVSRGEYYWSVDDNPGELQYEMNVEYDSATGKASKIEEKYYGEDYAGNTRVWTNLDWENTDGQIVTYTLGGAKRSLYASFMTGANRLKSADVLENNETAWSLSTEYSGEKDYSRKILSGNEIVRIETMEYTDDYGSYTRTIFSDGEWEQNLREYDEHGNIVLSAEAVGTDLENLAPVSSSFYENEYDPTTGALLQTIESRSEDGEMPTPQYKNVFSNFVEIGNSGIEGIESDSNLQLVVNGLTILASGASSLLVYNLDGMLVSSANGESVNVPTKGMYIVLIDGKPKKVVI